jgi:hypothetical protein
MALAGFLENGKKAGVERSERTVERKPSFRFKTLFQKNLIPFHYVTILPQTDSFV